MNHSNNPFQSKKGFNATKEVVQKAMLFCSTYAVLIFTLLIFGVILYRGVPVLVDKGWDFITRKPETLEVISFDAGKKLEIPADSFRTMKIYNKDASIISNKEEFEKPFNYKTFTIEPGSFISDGYLSEIEKDNDFRAKFKARDLNQAVSFNIEKDTQIKLDYANYSKFLAAKTSIASLEAKDIELKTESYKLTFEKAYCTIPAKTMVQLQDTSLIYYLYGNLRDKSDDEPNYPMPLDIPEQQTVLLTKKQHNAFLAAPGTAKVSNTEVVTATTQREAITLAKGSYTLPFSLFKILIHSNQEAGIAHQHNLDLGVIELDLKKSSDLIQLPESTFATIVADNPGLKIANVKDIVIDKEFVRFDFAKACEIQMPTSDMSALRLSNKTSKELKILKEHVHPYSAGGVSGPLWGTALLVCTCMVIALIIGVSAAVFLGEYSRQGKLINTIRLAMMNLAGVPSIVFGIFGLGLFVILAPKLTDTPTVQLKNKPRIAVFPSFSQPDLRKAERLKISNVEDAKNHDDAITAARLSGASRYYDGYYYLSFEGWGTSILAGAFTLAIMVLPIIITSSEESLRAVPRGFREASLALGATKWQSIRTAVLPYATPGILTASVLGITRVAGETAPIMFTAAVAEKSDLPINGLQGTGFDVFLEFISQNVQAMPYHIYTVSGKIPQSEYNKPMQFGSVLVFMIVVMSFAGLSVWLRARMRKKYKW